MGELSCDDIKLYMISYFFFNDKSFLCVEELAILLINIYINILHHDRDRSHFTFHVRPASVAFVAALVTNGGAAVAISVEAVVLVVLGTWWWGESTEVRWRIH